MNKSRWLSFLLPILTASCGEPAAELNKPKNRPVRSGYLATADGYVKVAYELDKNVAVIGGDIRIPEQQLVSSIEEKRIGLASQSAHARLWPDGRIPYQLPDNFGFTKELAHSIAEWKKAGVYWVPKADEDVDYVKFAHLGVLCGHAGLGRIGGIQEIGLPFANNTGGCDMTAILLHETAHTVGFIHEHQRPDRDAFVKFVKPDVQNTASYLIKIMGSVPLTPFDINSVTMLPSGNTGWAMAKPDGSWIYPSLKLSDHDISGAQKLYKTGQCLIHTRAGRTNLYDKVVIREKCKNECSRLSTHQPLSRCMWRSEKLR